LRSPVGVGRRATRAGQRHVAACRSHLRQREAGRAARWGRGGRSRL